MTIRTARRRFISYLEAQGCSPHAASGGSRPRRSGKEKPLASLPQQDHAPACRTGCGGYITKGRAVCQRSVVGKDTIEALVMDAIGQNIHAFLNDGGQDLMPSYNAPQKLDRRLR